MPSKKNEPKKLFDGMPVEPERPNQERPESAPVPDEQQAQALETNTTEQPVVPSVDTTAANDPQPEQVEESSDDILDDVRRSLIEEQEAHEKEEQPKWWKRIGKGSRKKPVEQEPPKVVEEIDLPGLTAAQITEENQPEAEPAQDLDPIDELIDMLDKEQTEKQNPVLYKEPEPEPAAPEPEKIVDIEDLKKQAFQPRPTSEQEEDISEVRSVALDGGEEVFVEVQSTKQDPLEERLSAMENALKPYRRYINFGLAALGLVMAVIAGLVLFNVYQQSVAAPPTQVVVSNLPFPTSVSLPGGWTFKLGRGALDSGQWNPKGAEWLQGTEVCRWVALPWSRQLEAVVRTLNREDPINLGMSNNDQLTYKVYSIQQMSPEEMQKLDSNTPCLLIVLAEPEAEKRWVLTAMP
ncbi:MAG TPA: hypothetical protein VK909_00605 [Anaerolineales bacterium]|nr:hypothetical protein [Anaerolineales bacterium]